MRALPKAAIKARNSAIHGRGVYARRFIPAFSYVMEYTGERITVAEVERRETARRQRIAAGEPPDKKGDDASCDYLFLLDDKWALDGRDSGNVARLINHSCEANCCTDIIDGRVWIISTRDIAEDEEITFDYGYTFRDARHNPCRCGTASCVGYIVASDQRWRVRRWRKSQDAKAAAASA